MNKFYFCLFSPTKNEKEWINVGYISANLNGIDEINVIVNKYTNSEIKRAVTDVDEKQTFAVGLSIEQNNFYICLEFASALKEKLPNIKVILFGNEATIYTDYIMEHCSSVDIIVQGEGEITFYELCYKILNNKGISDCFGIVYRDKLRVIKTEPRELINNLDDLRHPDRSFFPPEIYEHSIIGSRGCNGRCSFCQLSRLYNSVDVPSIVRERSIHNILEEISYLVNEHGYGYFTFRDNTFDNSKEGIRLAQLYDGLSKSNLKIHFSIYQRADLLSEEHIRNIVKLMDVGLDRVIIGIESGNAEDLKIFGKKASVEDNQRALDLLQRYNLVSGDSDILFQYGFIFFHPYTTLKALHEDLDFIEINGLHIDMDLILKPMFIFGSAPITKKIIRDGLLKQDSKLPITDPIAYNFQDKRIFMIYSILEEIYRKYSALRNIPKRVLTKIAINNRVTDTDKYINPSDTVCIYNQLNKMTINIFRTVINVVEYSKSRCEIDKVISLYLDDMEKSIHKLNILNMKLAISLAKENHITIDV